MNATDNTWFRPNEPANHTGGEATAALLRAPAVTKKLEASKNSPIIAQLVDELTRQQAFTAKLLKELVSS